MILDFLTLMPLFVSLLWAVVLITTSQHNKAKFILGIFMFTTFLLFLSHFIYYNNVRYVYVYFDLIFTFTSLSVFPLYYLYINLLTKHPKIELKYIKLFIPACVILFSSVIVYLMMSPELRNDYIDHYVFDKGSYKNGHPLVKTQLLLTYILQIIYFIQIIYSSILIKKNIEQYNDKINNYYSNVENKEIEWPKLILYSFILIAIVSVIFNFLGRTYFSQSVLLLSIPSLSYTILLFLFGYMGNLQNYSVIDFNIEEEKDNISMIMDDQEAEFTSQSQLISSILNLFETEKIHQKPDLKVTDIASSLFTNRTYVSNAINAHFKCSFNTLVNKYRIEEAKEILSVRQNNNFSLDFIATKVGFNNVHTFIRVFKELGGTTPGRYRDTVQKKLKAQ